MAEKTRAPTARRTEDAPDARVSAGSVVTGGSSEPSVPPTPAGSAGQVVSYRVCPVCSRATPSSAGENYCPNDGAELLKACPSCGAPIGSPFGEFCSTCGGRLFDD